MATTEKRSRNLGIDLMRAMAMFFVICLHILGQGGLVDHAVPGSGKEYFLVLLQILTNCAVDAYGITTGYLLCTRPFRLSRVTKLWLTTVFWSVAVSCCFFVILPGTRTLAEVVSMFLPLLRGRYWFFTAYVVTMLVSPVLNVVIRTLSKSQFKLLLAVMFFVCGVVPVASLGYDVMRLSGGCHFAWMIGLYLIGGYIRRYGVSGQEDRAGRALAGYFLIALVHLVYVVVITSVGFGNYRSLMNTNVSPLMVGEAVCLFRYFRALGGRICSNGPVGSVIRFATPGIYAVYVIHVHPIVFWSNEVIALFRPWDSRNAIVVFLSMIGVAAAVFTLCVLLDAVRQRLFCVLGIDRAAERLSDTAERKIRKLLSEDK